MTRIRVLAVFLALQVCLFISAFLFTEGQWSLNFPGGEAVDPCWSSTVQIERQAVLMETCHKFREEMTQEQHDRKVKAQICIITWISSEFTAFIPSNFQYYA